MEKDLLSEVIEVEKELQKNLDLEKDKSREWLEQIRKEFEEGFTHEETSLAESLRRSLEVAKQDAEAKASDIANQSVQKILLITKINNEGLSKIIGRHLSRILPV
jgi:vacuolar-type H+-ATPase subunit H